MSRRSNTRSSKLAPSPAVSRCLPTSTTRLSFLPNHHPKAIALLCIGLLHGEGWLRPRASPFEGSARHPYGVTAKPGLYYKPTPLNTRLLDEMRARTSLGYRRTPWLIGGDIGTLVPFLVNKPPQATYDRVWLSVPLADGPNQTRYDNDAPDAPDAGGGGGGGAPDPNLTQREGVALDLAVPEGGHDPSKPTVLLLAGLTGGSREGYVQDLVHACNARGITVAVMTARGAAGTPLRSDALFHGARTSDVATAARVLRRVVGEPSGARGRLIGVGVSMGGIVMANYAARISDKVLVRAGANTTIPEPRVVNLKIK